MKRAPETKLNQSKEVKYKELLPQIEALIAGERDLIANLSNCAAALKENFNFLWVGFYFVKNDELVLGPFQGPVACTRIEFNMGVCGACYSQGKTIIVPDVDEFPGHIACSSASKSEIVVPVKKEGKVLAVLDVDSNTLNAFDKGDLKYLERLCSLLSQVEWDK